MIGDFLRAPAAKVLRNLALSCRDWLSSRTLVRKFLLNRSLVKPRQLNIEVTSYCNARCIMCPRENMQRKMEIMPWPRFKKIIDEAKVLGVKRFALNGYGEIFTMGRFYKKFITYINETIDSPRIIINTNASLMKPQAAAFLIEAKVYAVNIDIDGATKKTFETVRRELKYEDVVKNAEHLIEEKKRRKVAYPIVRVGMIVQDENRAETEAHKKQWTGKADFVGAEMMVNRGGDVATGSERFQSNPCYLLWSELSILSDGSVALCCDDWDGKVKLGNVDQNSVADVWRGKALTSIRKMHESGNNDKVSLCKQCNWSRPGPRWFQKHSQTEVPVQISNPVKSKAS